MATPAIVLENVTKSFKIKKPSRFLSRSVNLYQNSKAEKLRAIDNISLSVQKGEMLGIIGMNASGKTTLLRIIAGILKPDSGKIQVNGELAPILQLGTGFQEELNAIDNIIWYGMLLGIPKKQIKEKVDTILDFAGLKNFAGMKIKNYSSGMRARLAFSTILQIEPDILLVDEVLAVGDQVFKEKCFEAFSSYKEKNKTILYTTHNLEKLSELSNRVLLIHQGKKVKIGKPNDVIEEYKEIMKKEKGAL